jgi:hypothetical protein
MFVVKKKVTGSFVMRSSFNSSSRESALYRSGESLHAAHVYSAPSIDSTQGLSGIGLLMQQVVSEIITSFGVSSDTM